MPLRKHFEIEEMQADHITPRSKAGKQSLKTVKCSAPIATAEQYIISSVCRTMRQAFFCHLPRSFLISAEVPVMPEYARCNQPSI